jgi:fructose-bisphosphate aldolase class II
MHGGSGVSDEDYIKSINAGIRKINYYTYGVVRAGEAIRTIVDSSEGKPVYWHDMTMAAYEAFYADFKKTIEVFANGAKPLA